MHMIFFLNFLLYQFWRVKPTEKKLRKNITVVLLEGSEPLFLSPSQTFFGGEYIVHKQAAILSTTQFWRGNVIKEYCMRLVAIQECTLRRYNRDFFPLLLNSNSLYKSQIQLNGFWSILFASKKG